MTHGRMLVQDEDGKKKLHLYTWHDGHTNEAYELLINLPLTLFDLARFSHFSWITDEKRDRSRVIQAPWFYGVSVDCRKEKETKESVEDYWSHSHPMEVWYASVANWITFVKFNTWTIVPSVKEMSYSSDEPDITVTVKDGGYLLSLPKEKEILEDVQEYAEQVNKTLGGVYVTVENKRIVVPFMEMIVQLHWQDFKDLDENKKPEAIAMNKALEADAKRN